MTIERDNFCFYTNRIKTDATDDKDKQINIQDAVITIPRKLINKGRADWKASNMDSVDIAIMCLDNILIHDCNSYQTQEIPNIYGDYALNIDIYADQDSDDDSANSFTFTLPIAYSGNLKK